MKREDLSAADRKAYDQAFDSGCFLDDGNPVKAPDLGHRLLAILLAVDTDSPWPQYVIDDATIVGLQSKGKAWQNRREIHQTKRGERIVRRSNVARLRAVTPETGESYYQAKFWEDMTRAEIEAQVKEANIRIATDRVRVRDGLRLLDLLDSTGREVVREALDQRHISLTDYLTA